MKNFSLFFKTIILVTYAFGKHPKRCLLAFYESHKNHVCLSAKSYDDVLSLLKKNVCNSLGTLNSFFSWQLLNLRLGKIEAVEKSEDKGYNNEKFCSSKTHLSLDDVMGRHESLSLLKEDNAKKNPFCSFICKISSTKLSKVHVERWVFRYSLHLADICWKCSVCVKNSMESSWFSSSRFSVKIVEVDDFLLLLGVLSSLKMILAFSSIFWPQLRSTLDRIVLVQILSKVGGPKCNKSCVVFAMLARFLLKWISLFSWGISSQTPPHRWVTLETI